MQLNDDDDDGSLVVPEEPYGAKMVHLMLTNEKCESLKYFAVLHDVLLFWQLINLFREFIIFDTINFLTFYNYCGRAHQRVHKNSCTVKLLNNGHFGT